MSEKMERIAKKMTDSAGKLCKINKENKGKLLLSMIFDILCFALVVWSIFSYFIGDESTNPMAMKAKCFRFFTIDSNILAALSCVLHFIYNIILFEKHIAIPKWVSVVKYIGTCGVVLTFITVLVLLGPTMGFASMIYGSNLFLHLICPLLCLISFCFLDEKMDFPKVSPLFGVIPAFVYGCLYLTMVIFVGESNGGWADIYGFNIGGFWYITFVVMMLATYLFSTLILKLYNRLPVKK